MVRMRVEVGVEAGIACIVRKSEEGGEGVNTEQVDLGGLMEVTISHFGFKAVSKGSVILCYFCMLAYNTRNYCKLALMVFFPWQHIYNTPAMPITDFQDLFAFA